MGKKSGKGSPASYRKEANAPRRVIGLRIDMETRSSTPIKFGAYRYTEDPDFKALVIAYSMIVEYPGGGTRLRPIKTLDFKNKREVKQFKQIVLDPDYEKHAFNANFERISLSRWLGMSTGEYIDPENWHCSAIQANTNGIYGTLDEVSRAVRSPAKKDARGKALIKFFSVPMNARDQKRADGVCGCVTFHEPSRHPKEFREYEDYCRQDVLTEAAAVRGLAPISPKVQAEYEADQRINDRGFRHRAKLARQAIAQVKVERDRLMGELRDLTGVENPNSGPQMMKWLESKNYPMVSLDKAHREEAAADPLCPDEVLAALELKGAASLSSVTKHQAALDTRCSDGRIRGSLQFYGAHTGREAGRGIQPQNLPRAQASLEDISALLKGRAGSRAPEIAKGAVRASIVPARGYVFVTADYNAIEARVLAGLAGETTAEAEFRGEGKIYEFTAAMMFGVLKKKIIKGRIKCGECGKCEWCNFRGKGKVSNLALGYAGGAGALVTMGAEKEGIDCGNYKELNAEWKSLGMPGKFHEWNRDAHDYPELLRLRDLYRSSFPMTERFWKHCATAWDQASDGKAVKFGQNACLTMMRDGRHNRLVLPSGRSIWYRYAQSHPSDTNPDRIDRRTFIGKAKGVGHVRTDTHGGKLTENVTQAVARDVMFDLIMKLEKRTAKGWPARTVLHVHDEVVLEVPEKHAEQVLADTVGLMSVAPSWGKFLVVKGEGKIMERYGK